MTFSLFPCSAVSRGGASENKFRCTIAALPHLRALGARWPTSTPDGRQDERGQSRHSPPGYDCVLWSDAEPPAHVIGTLSHDRRERGRPPSTTLMTFPRPTVGFGS
jgi:hypothetical protein